MLGSVIIWILIFEELNVSVSFCKIYNTVNNISSAYARWMILESHRSPSNGASISIKSWVAFPSRFISRTACFPRKVSYFRESRMPPWKKWSWMKSNSEARPSTVFLFCYTSIFTILQPLGSGYHEIKVNELPDWDWAWSDGTKAANWGSLKGYLCECFYLSSHILHVSMHFEKSHD